MRIDDHAQLRVEAAELEPATAKSPELMAPLARALNNGKCAVCGARVWGVADPSLEIPEGRVQIACWGEPRHVFIFDTTTGHIDDQPTTMGTQQPAR
jgi:hypothetical protein